MRFYEMKGHPTKAFNTILLLWTLFALSSGLPTNDDLPKKDVNREAKALVEDPSHSKQKEPKGERPLDSVINTLFSPEASSTVDRMASSVVKLAGGVVEDLGDFLVESMDEFPNTIRLISDAVGKAVQTKREKVVIMIRGTPLEEEVNRAKQASDRITSAVQKSQFESSLRSLEDAFASLIGKFIGATYKNADPISSAFTQGFKRIAGTEEELKVLSRSNKENEISPEKSTA